VEVGLYLAKEDICVGGSVVRGVVVFVGISHLEGGRMYGAGVRIVREYFW